MPGPYFEQRKDVEAEAALEEPVVLPQGAKNPQAAKPKNVGTMGT